MSSVGLGRLSFAFFYGQGFFIEKKRSEMRQDLSRWKIQKALLGGSFMNSGVLLPRALYFSSPLFSSHAPVIHTSFASLHTLPLLEELIHPPFPPFPFFSPDLFFCHPDSKAIPTCFFFHNKNLRARHVLYKYGPPPQSVGFPLQSEHVFILLDPCPSSFSLRLYLTCLVLLLQKKCMKKRVTRNHLSTVLLMLSD